VCHDSSLVLLIAQCSCHPRFGEESVEKMVNWALENVPPRSDLSVLEVGSGNGTLLFALVEEGYAADRLMGIDYSEGAVSLASSIAETRSCGTISFHQLDFLKEQPPPLSEQEAVDGGAWDLILDKGTFDAIALMQKDDNGKSPADDYPSRIAKLLKPGAYFLITCKSGWTQPVLIAHTTSHSLQLYRGRVARKVRYTNHRLAIPVSTAPILMEIPLTLGKLSNTTPNIYIWREKREYMLQCCIFQIKGSLNTAYDY